MSSEPTSLSGSKLTEEINEIRGDVQKYKPGDASTCADQVKFPPQLCIGLFGRTGCGKTSLINSLKFAAHGKLRRSQWQQAAGQEKAGGHTMFRKLADMTKKIFVIDNRGLDEPNTEQAITELAAQLDGKRGYSDIIEWQKSSNDDDDNDDDDEDPDLRKLNPNTGHPISCAVFVFSAGHDIDTNTTGLTEVVDFLHGHQGRYPVAIITHVDVAERSHVENLKTVLRISGVCDIFEVANLTSEKELLEEPYQHSLLSLLERCMTDGDETLIFKHYQRKEQERKKEIDKRREEKRRKKEEERIAEECRQMAERERIERENQMRRELEEQRRELERQRERAAEEERERREAERERRFQEAISKAEADKQEELRRIMDANKKEEGGCMVM